MMMTNKFFSFSANKYIFLSRTIKQIKQFENIPEFLLNISNFQTFSFLKFYAQKAFKRSHCSVNNLHS